MNADVCKGPLKEKYNVYSIKEEGKHCSAPGSQVLTDFFFFPPSLTCQEKEGILVPAFLAFCVSAGRKLQVVAWVLRAPCATAAPAKTPGDVARALPERGWGAAWGGKLLESASDAQTTG